jgi:hypothetical protein
MKTTMKGIRMPANLIQCVEARAQRYGMTFSQVVRQILKRFLRAELNGTPKRPKP